MLDPQGGRGAVRGGALTGRDPEDRSPPPCELPWDVLVPSPTEDKQPCWVNSPSFKHSPYLLASW